MNRERRSLLGAAAAALLLPGCAGGGGAASGSDSTAGGSGSGGTSGMRDIDSVAFTQRMGAGWNLGNSMEAIGGETAWGNPPVTLAMLQAVKAAGFGTVRMPLAWKQYADASDTIGRAWMERVVQVVGWAQQAGLVVMINVHWDGGWLQPTYAQQAAANTRLARYWTQIATRFRDHDDTLLFAGTNEVMKEGDYGTPTAEYAAVQNGFNQVFVDTVRATGGNNRVRHLVVQGFNTNIDHTVAFAVLPRDSASRRLMMEVHYYDPYNFALNDQSGIWQWGAGATDPAATDTWGNEAYADAQFAKMKASFVDRGVGVILGEFGAIARPQAGAETFRLAWNRHIARSAWTHGLVPVYWDNGVNAVGGFGLFDRRSGAPTQPALIRAIVDAVR